MPIRERGPGPRSSERSAMICIASIAHLTNKRERGHRALPIKAASACSIGSAAFVKSCNFKCAGSLRHVASQIAARRGHRHAA